ncbi:cobalamin biosynthesis protein CobW [Microbaculum sp. FT89]|uniref:cobalamin biosynthesis protein CobW n=1 Tax=Microbaculum sp. FT89 TaxID=3447298 RepID=UPI003F533089
MSAPAPKLSGEKIPATVITGFLGAGKTTLVRHVLENANGRRIAIIVNEFGSLGIDGDLLKSCGIAGCTDDDIVELANGCICCTVADDFLPTMQALLDRDDPPEHVLIETSGLALPKPLIKAFDWPTIRSRMTVDGVIAVVDGPAVATGRFADDPDAIARQRAEDPSVDHDNPLAEVYEDQLNAADLIVVNKADLLDAAGIDALKQGIAGAVPRAVKVVSAYEGRIDPAVLLGIGAAAEDDLDARPSHHDGADDHEHDDFESFVVEIGEIADPDTLVTRLRAVAEAHDILRIKGFVPVSAKPMRLAVQGVGGRFRHAYDRPWTPTEQRVGRLVVIGETGLDQAAIDAAIRG